MKKSLKKRAFAAQNKLTKGNMSAEEISEFNKSIKEALEQPNGIEIVKARVEEKEGFLKYSVKGEKPNLSDNTEFRKKIDEENDKAHTAFNKIGSRLKGIV
jgi:tripartite-type tricarboxylate transporter receptor subunit TctC